MHNAEISVDDPRAEDVRVLLERHLEFARSHTPPEGVFALQAGEFLDPAIVFCSYRRGGELLAVGALRHLDRYHGELKSMHTAAEARGRGIGRAMVDHLIGVARDRGYERVSLETGSMAAFTPARSLYARAGFTVCGPFGDYQYSATSTFMTLALAGPASTVHPAPHRAVGVIITPLDGQQTHTHADSQRNDHGGAAPGTTTAP